MYTQMPSTFNSFYNDMIGLISIEDNKKEDGSIEWNFVDSDLFEKWQVILDGETYSEYFDRAADVVEKIQ